jgi:hypothetical protein
MTQLSRIIPKRVNAPQSNIIDLKTEPELFKNLSANAIEGAFIAFPPAARQINHIRKRNVWIIIANISEKLAIADQSDLCSTKVAAIPSKVHESSTNRP